MRMLITAAVILFSSMSQAKNSPASIHYDIHISAPHTHYARVDVTLDNPGKTELLFKMPVWTPGSYLVREFEKSVEQVSALADGKSVSCAKTDKNTWKIAAGKAAKVVFSYQVYAFEFSVRTSYIDADQALINPTSVCMFVQGFEQLAGTLSLHLPEGFRKVSTSLNQTAAGTYAFSHYDELADSPIQAGNHEELNFEVLGVPHTVAMVGRNNADKARFVKDLKKMCEVMAGIVGTHPCKRYLFIVHNTESGGGGLEHLNSTVVVMNRFAWTDEVRYRSFLGLCAHEYFHLWNVKRIRPVELGPFNYNQENYTQLLWVAEGITSYYDELALLRAGLVSKDEFLNSLENYINDLENRSGSRVQTLAESSFDAWIKEYRPNENSKNTSISYYAKGLVVASLLDAEICASTNGSKNLDDVMKLLWKRYYLEKNKGFTVDEFEAAAAEIAGKDLKAFFNRHVRSVDTPNYQQIYKRTGLETAISREKRNTLGITTAAENGRTIIKQTDRGLPGYESGLSVNDELIALDGIRVQNDAEDILKKLGYPAVVNALINRGGLIRTVEVRLSTVTRFKINLQLPDDATPALNKWLGK